LPILFITKYYTPAAVGYYALSIKLVAAPLTILSKSIKDVLLRKVSELVNAGRYPLNYILKLTFILTIIISVPFLVITFFGKDLVPFVFGKQWEQAGIFVGILMPSLSLKFIVSPLISVLPSTGNNKYFAYSHIISFAFTFLVLFVFAGKVSEIDILVKINNTDLFIYSIYYLFIIIAARNPKKTS